MLDATVTAGDTPLIDEGFLCALRDPEVVAAARAVRRSGGAARIADCAPVVAIGYHSRRPQRRGPFSKIDQC